MHIVQEYRSCRRDNGHPEVQLPTSINGVYVLVLSYICILYKEQIINTRISVNSIWIITTTETLKLFSEPNSEDNSYFE